LTNIGQTNIMPSPPISPLDTPSARAIGEVFDLYDPPLWLVTSAHAGRRGGLIATFAVRASIVAAVPRMVLGVAKQHHTWGLIEGSGGFALHLLHPDQLDLVWRFGLATGHQVDKFGELTSADTPGGQPLIADALAWLDCRCESHLDSGDRTIYLAAVTAGGTDTAAGKDAGPLTVRRLYAEAPPDARARLDALYAHDGAVDAAAIRAWRSLQQGGPGQADCATGKTHPPAPE
jgi:flavin reductase (DIM6/NTAB) family NADH-FMN oxidoreductase RutF